MSDAPAPARTPGRRPLRYATPDAVLADVARLRAGGYTKVGRWTLPQACHHLATVIGGNLVPPPTDDEPTPEQLAMKAKFFATVRNPAGMPEGMPLPPERCPPDTCTDADIDALAAAFKALADYPHARLMVGRCGPVPTDEVRDLHLVHCAHHLSFLQPTTVRRTLDYRSLADVAADVGQLRKGYVRSATWTLPQVCWHLRSVMERTAARPMSEPTPEMLARRPMLDGILAGQPLPSGLPTSPELTPPDTAGDADVDGFLAFLAGLQSQPPKPVMHRLFGPLTADQAARLTLIHCANHLSYLVPTA